MRFRAIIYSITLSAGTVFTAGAQFTSPVSGTTYTTDKVGIGTSTPAKPLHIISPQGLRLEGTAYGTNILDLVPGQTTLWDRLDIKAVNANRGSSLMLIPNGTATSTKFVMSNQSDLANYSSMYILADGTGVWISPQNNGTPDNSIANLSLGGGTGGRNWTNVLIPNGNVGIGTTTPAAKLDVGATTGNVLSSVLGRLSEGNTAGEGTYLGIRSLATQPANVSSFSLEHKFGGQINSAINFNRGSTYQGGFITFETNDGTEKMRIGADGRVGIGTASPADALHVIGAISAKNSASATNNGITINAGRTVNAGSTDVNRLRYGGNDANSTYFTIQGPGETDMITINNGNVGIGTTAPGAYKLAVEGTIGARRVRVTSSPNWADYVFDKDYKLPSLNEVENFIQQNRHLPDVPSAKDVAANGIDLGDNQVVLLKKVEELTLYSIQQDKKLSEQNTKLEQKDTEVKELKQTLESVLKRLALLEKK